jgi:hypothetical protein
MAHIYALERDKGALNHAPLHCYQNSALLPCYRSPRLLSADPPASAPVPSKPLLAPQARHCWWACSCA